MRASSVVWGFAGLAAAVSRSLGRTKKEKTTTMRKLLAAAAVFTLAITGSAFADNELTLTKVDEDATTITLAFQPVAGAVGYQFVSSLTPKKPHTWDATRSTVRFEKGGTYRVVALMPGPNGSYPPPPAPQAALFVTPSGSDSGLCTQAQPCRSFQRAYSVAQCGDTVRVAPGTYPAQSFTEITRLNGCTVPVVFQAQGATVTGDVDFGRAPNGVQNVTVDGLAFTGVARLQQSDANNITLNRVDGGSFIIDGADNVTIRDSDFGPCKSRGGTGCDTTESQNRIRDDSSAGAGTNNILIEGNRIHDFTQVNYSDHFECIWTTGGTNVVIRGNKFYNCHTYAIAIGTGSYNGRQSRYVGWVIENNWFGQTCCYLDGRNRNSSIMLGGSAAGYAQGTTILIRFNSFAPGQTVLREGTDGISNVTVAANIMQSYGCTPGVTYRNNLMAGPTCHTTDKPITSFPYTNPSTGASQDYHLNGPSPADGHATGVPAPATDIDGNPRGPNPDAGSHERT